MKNKQELKWFLDLIILSGFLVSFFLDVTGVILHQWLGVILFFLSLIHMITHKEWLNKVVGNLLLKIAPRAKVYLAIDFLLLAGLTMIVITGLIISTWFNLILSNYDAWLTVHIYTSMITLLFAVLKIGLHWRWIVLNTRKIFNSSQHTVVLDSSPSQVKAISRRQFLATMGVVGLGSAIALSSALSKIKLVQSAALSENLEKQAIQQPTATEVQATTTQEQVEATQTTAASTATPVPQVTTTATTQPTAQTALVCSQTCRKGRHCAYPGQCHDYRDSNSNGLCDLGECG